MEEIQNIEDQVNNIKDGASTDTLNEALEELDAATKDTALFEGDLDTSINTLGIAVEITNDSLAEEDLTKETENFIQIASNLIDERNKPSWMSRIEEKRKGAMDLSNLVEQYVSKKLDKLGGDKEETIAVKNIYIKIGSEQRSLYKFPELADTNPDWVSSTQTGISINGEAFKDFEKVHFAYSSYRNITSILVKKLKQDGVVSDVTLSLDINADLVSFQTKEDVGVIDPPAEIIFQIFDANYSDPVCCYWDFKEEAFVTDGCTLKSHTDNVVVCSCNHFTNFAVLMSPGKTPAADVMALSIISAVGCGISILCLSITIFLHILVWRFVKSGRSVLLLNLCIALIIAYVVFLAGVNRTENETVCTVISALLHYFYLVVFFLMLAYGIEITVSVVYVFVTRSRTKWLLPLAWGLPLVVVGATMGITQLEGYGNDRFCWLSIDNGVLFAFVGPAGLVILINFVFVIIVLRQMFKSSAMMTKSDKEKAVTGVRSICVLLPILGLTWVFGVFSVNEDLVAFQYIFAICNTLQGFLIFIFHCILNKTLMQALKQRNERKKTLASIENSLKNQHSTATSTAYYTQENKQAQNNFDSERETSNPFLQADRQVKEIVSKNKKTTNVNDNVEANNKLDVDKASKAVDLDDVKISNILRESEVMGGSAGVSSILQIDTDSDINNRQNGSNMRASVASSNRYDRIDPELSKPAGYERLLQASGLEPSPFRESVHTGSDRSKDKEKDKKREKEIELERERERERQKKIEKEKKERFEKERKEYMRMEKENEERERKERERIERERREREQRERESRAVIRIGFDRDAYRGGHTPAREGSYERRGDPRLGRSSRSDDDYEGMSSAQNISSISTALPEKFDLYQSKKHQQKDVKKQAESSVKKKTKKSSLKDRSKAYEYSYDSTYLGGSSRHASLESMNMQQYGYSPYGQMPGMGGYQTGRPTHQQQHWDQYRYQRDPRDPYTREYW